MTKMIFLIKDFKNYFFRQFFSWQNLFFDKKFLTKIFHEKYFFMTFSLRQKDSKWKFFLRQNFFLWKKSWQKFLFLLTTKIFSWQKILLWQILFHDKKNFYDKNFWIEKICLPKSCKKKKRKNSKPKTGTVSTLGLNYSPQQKVFCCGRKAGKWRIFFLNFMGFWNSRRILKIPWALKIGMRNGDLPLKFHSGISEWCGNKSCIFRLAPSKMFDWRLTVSWWHLLLSHLLTSSCNIHPNYFVNIPKTSGKCCKMSLHF